MIGILITKSKNILKNQVSVRMNFVERVKIKVMYFQNMARKNKKYRNLYDRK